MVVWDIMGYEGPSVGKTSIQTEQISGEKVQEIETAQFETRLMNKIGAQINVNLRRHFLGTSLITLSPLLAWRRSFGFAYLIWAVWRHKASNMAAFMTAVLNIQTTITSLFLSQFGKILHQNKSLSTLFQ